MVKSVIRFLLYLLITLLLMEVLKRLAIKIGYSSGFVWVMRFSALQFVLIAGSFFGLFFGAILSRVLKKRSAILFSVLLSTLLLIVAESRVRYLLNHPDKISANQLDGFIYYYDFFDANLLQYENDAMQYDSTLFYKFIPHTTVKFVNREFQTDIESNSFGLRDSDSAIIAPAMIFLGDSHTMGWGVQQEQAFPALVAKLSGKRVLNAGIPSYGTARELKLLKYLDTSRLEQLIIQYCSNDIEENDHTINNGGVLTVSSKATFDSVNNLYKGTRQYFPFKHMAVWGNRAIKQQISSWTKAKIDSYGRNPSVENAEAQASQFIKLLSNAPIDFSSIKITVLHFNHTGTMDSSFAVSLKRQMNVEAVRKRFPGVVSIVNVYNVLKPSDFFILDPHMNAGGHAKVAQELWKVLK